MKASWIYQWHLEPEAETRKNRCRLSITTFVSGIVGKSRGFDTLYTFCFDLGSLDRVMFSSIVLVPDGFEIDHFFSTSARSVIVYMGLFYNDVVTKNFFQASCHRGEESLVQTIENQNRLEYLQESN